MSIAYENNTIYTPMAGVSSLVVKVPTLVGLQWLVCFLFCFCSAGADPFFDE